MDQFEEQLTKCNFNEQLSQLERGQQLLQLALCKYQSEECDLSQASVDSEEILGQENYDETLADNLLKCRTSEDYDTLFNELLTYHQSQDFKSIAIKVLQFSRRLIINMSYEEVIGKQASDEQLIKKLNEDNFLLQKKMFETQEQLDQSQAKLSKITQLSNQFQEVKRQLKMYQGDVQSLKSLKMGQLSQLESSLMKSMQAIQEIKTANLIEFEKNRLCTICYENKICILLRPCGHANVCSNCITQIKQCPLDRSQIQQWEKIFLP